MEEENPQASLLRYKAWANEMLYDLLSNTADAVLESERPIIFGSIIRTLNHTFAMDVVWQAHLQGGVHGFTTRNPEQCPRLAELREWQRKIDAWYIVYATSISSETANEAVSFSFIGGGNGTMRRTEILSHVVNHATYHRGHVAAMLYDSGIAPPTTDLPVYLRSIESVRAADE